MSLVPLVAFLCVILAVGAHGSAIFFNNSVISACVEDGGCDLLNSTIYVGGVVPNNTEIVYINVTSPVLLFLTPGSYFQVAGINLQGNVTLSVHNNASLYTTGDLNLNGAALHVHSNGTVNVEWDVKLENSSNLFLYGLLSVVNDFFSFNSSVSGYSGAAFQVFGNSRVISGAQNFYTGSDYSVVGTTSSFDGTELNFEIKYFFSETAFNAVNANFSGGIGGFSAQLFASNFSIYGSFGIDQPFTGFFIDGASRIHFYSVNGFIDDSDDISSIGLAGTGTYIIASSNFSVNLPYTPLEATLILAGETKFITNNLFLNGSKIQFEADNGQAPNITLDLNGNATIVGNFHLPGHIVVRSGSSVVLNGTISLDWGLHANVSGNVSTQIQAIGSLTSTTPIFLTGHFGEHAFTAVNSIITAPSIQINDFLLQSVNTSHFVGNLINNGAVHVLASNNIIVQGNYTQLANAYFDAYNLSLTGHRTPVNLVVNGTADISGVLKFSTIETAKNETFEFTVLVANEVKGSFAEKQFSGDDISKLTSTVSYTHNSIQVKIEPTPSSATKKYFGLHWWVWVIIAAAAVVVIAVLLVVVVKRVKRTEYEPVRA